MKRSLAILHFSNGMTACKAFYELLLPDCSIFCHEVCDPTTFNLSKM